MIGKVPVADRFWSLLDAACAGTLVEPQAQELGALLDSDLLARSLFIDHMQLRRDIQAMCRAERVCDRTIAQIVATFPEVSLPSSPSPVFGFLSTAYHGTIGFFSQEVPFSLLIAAVLTSLGLWFASMIYVSSPDKIAKDSSLPVKSSFDPTLKVVGKITGMVDCKWSTNSLAPSSYDNILLGRQFTLDSGLMEITYETGAKVILQGPVTYKVESKNGGFLPIGKLTGKVENKTAKGFAVRTPTATITDLGTEFGVEVDKEANTTSHVFRGSVEVKMVSANGKAEGVALVLHENQSTRVENHAGNREDGNRVTMFASPAKPTNFVRKMPRVNSKSIIKVFDFVDVVAGGDGHSGKRNAGINPTNGQTVIAPPKNMKDDMFGDGKFHRVEGRPFIDGVFIPDGRLGAVQTDSAGHRFAGFLETSNRTSGYVWAGGSIPTWMPSGIPAKFNGLDVDYASSGHGLLFMHANKAISFDLEAIRHANPACKLLRFRSVAGSTSACIDLWVLVDGQSRFQRRGISSWNGACWIDVPLGRNDRFLTLVVTDGGDGIRGDWAIYGDPQLEMASADATAGGKAAD